MPWEGPVNVEPLGLFGGRRPLHCIIFGPQCSPFLVTQLFLLCCLVLCFLKNLFLPLEENKKGSRLFCCELRILKVGQEGRKT